MIVHSAFQKRPTERVRNCEPVGSHDCNCIRFTSAAGSQPPFAASLSAIARPRGDLVIDVEVALAGFVAHRDRRSRVEPCAVR